MDGDGQGPSRNAGKPDWFLHWLKEVFLPASRDPIKSQVKKFEDAVERIPDCFVRGILMNHNHKYLFSYLEIIAIRVL